MPAAAPLFGLPKYESVRVTAPDGTRQYETPLGLVPSVTTVLSGSRDNSAIEQWRNAIGAERADQITATACWRGDRHHENIENLLLNGVEPKLNMVTMKYWKSTAEFLTTIRHPVLCEGAVWHPEKFAGAFDCLAFLDDDDDQPTLCDWKTADRPRKPDKLYEYKLQVAAYRAALNFVYAKQGLKVRRAKVVIALANQKPQIETVEEDALDQLFNHFLARLERFYL